MALLVHKKKKLTTTLSRPYTGYGTYSWDQLITLHREGTTIYDTTFQIMPNNFIQAAT
ncbi:hypothetical protein [Monoglobus pectinilyticus]|uniref:hypothetical protein n=1 Tax=Monoglobus pectinilyticus TaxID=1981510 RepID=UPI00399AEDD1